MGYSREQNQDFLAVASVKNAAGSSGVKRRGCCGRAKRDGAMLLGCF